AKRWCQARLIAPQERIPEGECLPAVFPGDDQPDENVRIEDHVTHLARAPRGPRAAQRSRPLLGKACRHVQPGSVPDARAAQRDPPVLAFAPPPRSGGTSEPTWAKTSIADP